MFYNTRQRDFADIIKVTDLKIGRVSSNQWAQSNHMSPLSRELSWLEAGEIQLKENLERFEGCEGLGLPVLV